jgi:hypothetical protein
MIVIRLPVQDAHSLAVALAPCPCRSTKSTATTAIRERFCKALARATAKEFVRYD